MKLRKTGTASSSLRGDIGRRVRGALTRFATPPRSSAPRIIAGLALASASAALALMFAPRTGREMRQIARSRANDVRLGARDLAMRAREMRKQRIRLVSVEQARRNDAASS